MPWFTDAGLLYYRKDLLDTPPRPGRSSWRWHRRSRRRRESRTASSSRGQLRGGVCNALEYIRTNGGDVLSDVTSGEVIMTAPAAGLETYRSMVADGVAPQAVVNYTETESVPIFGNGESVFLREWPGTYGDIQGGAYKLKGEQVGSHRYPWPRATRASAPSADGTWRSTPKPTCRMRPGHSPSS